MPSGSSTGSTIAVATGFTPFAIGTETNGSLVWPASRAALYSIKPTIGVVSQDGIAPISHNCDSAGPIAKTPRDLALLFDAMLEEKGTKSMLDASTNTSWSDIVVGAVDHRYWMHDTSFLRREVEVTAQIVQTMRDKISVRHY
jgi:amidase